MLLVHVASTQIECNVLSSIQLFMSYLWGGGGITTHMDWGQGIILGIGESEDPRQWNGLGTVPGAEVGGAGVGGP